MGFKKLYHKTDASFEVSVSISLIEKEEDCGNLMVEWKHSSAQPQMKTISCYVEKASIFDCTEFPSSLHGPSDSKRLANVFLTLFIVTDSGEMLATHLTAQDCYVIPLGTCDLDVVWIGIVGGMGSLTLRPISDNRHIFSHVVLGKKDGPNCICVVQYTGDCLLSLKPTAEKDSAEKDSAQQEPAIVWKEFLLEGPVISCSSFENTIITTDGNWVRICELNSIENKSTCENLNCSCGLTVDVSTKSFVLKGIYKVSSDEDSVVLLTVDGRTYEYSWNSFLALFDKCDEGNAHEARFSGTSLDNILKEMERLSTVSNDLATEKDELRSYIQQLNLAQSLALNENKMVSKSYRETLKKSFELLYEITPSASDKFAFAIKISLKNTIRDVKFNHKWWHCKVSLNLPPKSEHVTFQLKAESSDHQILMSVTVEDLKNSLLNSLETSDSVNFLSCSLILKNYINKHAVCAIDVTKVNILLSDFLHESKLIKSSNPSTFADFISKSFPSSNLSQISCPKNQDIVLVYPATKNLLEKLHKISQNNYSQQPTEIEKHFPIKKDLYWCEHLVQFQASILSDKVCINLNSSCIPLIILLRREIEDLARKDSQKSKVRLSRTVVNEISNLSQILDLSLDYPDDSVPVSDLYCQISKIASQLP